MGRTTSSFTPTATILTWEPAQAPISERNGDEGHEADDGEQREAFICNENQGERGDEIRAGHGAEVRATPATEGIW